MNNNGYYLCLNNHDIANFKVILGDIDGERTHEYSSLGSYESVTSTTFLSPFKRNHGGKYTDSLKRDLTMVFYDEFNEKKVGLTQDEYAEFQETYFNREDYLRLEFPDHPTLSSYYYMAKLLNPQETIINGQIAKISCEVECDSPYGYCVQDYEDEWTTAGAYVVKCESHQDSTIYPDFIIEGNGKISIINDTNGSGVIIKVATGETVHIDKNLFVSTTDTSKKYKMLDCDLSNYKFLKLNKGVNKIRLLTSDSISKIHIQFPICKKIGW